MSETCDMCNMARDCGIHKTGRYAPGPKEFSRDEWAAECLRSDTLLDGLLRCEGGTTTVQRVADAAYKFADAMLKERRRERL